MFLHHCSLLAMFPSHNPVMVGRAICLIHFVHKAHICILRHQAHFMKFCRTGSSQQVIPPPHSTWSLSLSNVRVWVRMWLFVCALPVSLFTLSPTHTKLYHLITYASVQEYKTILKNNAINNFAAAAYVVNSLCQAHTFTLSYTPKSPNFHTEIHRLSMHWFIFN